MAKDKPRLKAITDRLDQIEMSLKSTPEETLVITALTERLESLSVRLDLQSPTATEVAGLATRLVALETKPTARSVATMQLKDISSRVDRLEQRLEELLARSGEFVARRAEALNRSFDAEVVSEKADLDGADSSETARSEAAALEVSEVASEPTYFEQHPVTPEPNGPDPATGSHGSVSEASAQWWNDDVTAGLAPMPTPSEDEHSPFIAAPDPAARPPRVVTIDPNPLPAPAATAPSVRRFKKALRRGDPPR